MARQKLIRYGENAKDDLVIQPGKAFFDEVKKDNTLRSQFFWNNNPIVLELACGKGEYTVWLAPHFPNQIFIGIDRKGPRLRYGAQEAKDNWFSNVAFLRTIIHHLDQFFAPGSVEEIRIIHPDPRPKGADTRRRLTCPRFLDIYKKILKADGIIRLKTDDQDLFTYSLETLQEEWREVFAETKDLYNDELLLAEHFDIKTHYEILFHKQGRTICYLKAKKPWLA